MITKDDLLQEFEQEAWTNETYQQGAAIFLVTNEGDDTNVEAGTNSSIHSGC